MNSRITEGTKAISKQGERRALRFVPVNAERRELTKRRQLQKPPNQRPRIRPWTL